MAQLTETDKATFRRLTRRGWEQTPEERSPHFVEQTPEGRARYINWASEASKFFKGTKPVDFSGNQWKL
jgi:hypothetical protein